MNNKQIKEELRRSACEDADPAFQIDNNYYYVANKFRIPYEGKLIIEMPVDDCRTFFLIVAEAM